MKKQTKSKTIFTIAITLLLVFLCTFSGTYAYFAVNNNKSQTTNMIGFGAYIYFQSGGFSNEQTQLYPVKNSVIARGNRFGITSNANNTTTTPISFGTLPNTSSAYIRFWIDAYLTEDPSINYGKYFTLYLNKNEAVGGSTNVACSYDAQGYPKTYFLKSALNSGERCASLFDSLQISWAAPIKIIENSLRISISFDAVQATNQAYKYSFNDDRGYYSNWS